MGVRIAHHQRIGIGASLEPWVITGYVDKRSVCGRELLASRDINRNP